MHKDSVSEHIHFVSEFDGLAEVLCCFAVNTFSIELTCD